MYEMLTANFNEFLKHYLRFTGNLKLKYKIRGYRYKYVMIIEILFRENLRL